MWKVHLQYIGDDSNLKLLRCARSLISAMTVVLAHLGTRLYRRTGERAVRLAVLGRQGGAEGGDCLITPASSRRPPSLPRRISNMVQLVAF